MTRGVEEPVLFGCSGDALVGILHRPAVDTHDVAVLMIVGGPQYRVGSHRQFVCSARAISGAGFPVLRFDYRGMGDSGGVYAGFEGVADDISAAIDVLQEACRPANGIVLFGLCDAASAALMYCRSDPRVAGLVLINPWVRSMQTHAAVVVKRYYGTRLLQRDFWRKLVTGGVDLAGSLRSLANNLARAAGRSEGGGGGGFIGAMRAGFTAFTGPVLLVRSGCDLTADEFRALCREDASWRAGIARGTVETIDLPEADHTFSRAAHLAQFNDGASRWLARHFGRGVRP